MKGTDNEGLAQRISKFREEYKDGGIACTDFGSFDSSVTDKCTQELDKPGLRAIVEKHLIDAFASLAPHSPDMLNAKNLRWRKKAVVRFDTLDLLTQVLIRFSGDGLTSVGSYAINWVLDKVIDAIAEFIADKDWRTSTFTEMCLFMTEFLDDPEFISECMEKVERHAAWTWDGIRREAYGMHVRPPSAEFIAGEGNDRAKGFKWQYIAKFQTSDYSGVQGADRLGTRCWTALRCRGNVYRAPGSYWEGRIRQDD